MRNAPKYVFRFERAEVWRLAKDGQILTCELTDDSAAGAGCEIVLRRDGEIIVGHHSGSRGEAEYAALTFAQDHLRTGWTLR